MLFLQKVLQSRVDLGVDWNDAETNIYLSNILEHPPTHHIHLYEIDMNHDSYRNEYFEYKATGDYILLYIGIFDHVSEIPEFKFYKISDDVYVGRAKAYYSYAASIRKRLSGNNVISDTMDKLSDNLNLYLNVLCHLRQKYFDIAKKR
jgi:hypothetical protein